MADRATAVKWLKELTHVPTASGLEHGVVGWVEVWVGRRKDLTMTRDSGGNLLITQKGRKRHPLVLAVAHMDHPAFVITGVDQQVASFEFRGGVDAAYFDSAPVRVASRDGGVQHLRVTDYDPVTQTGTLSPEGDSGTVEPGDIAMWSFPRSTKSKGLFKAPACDDLAGVAAALVALDRARSRPGLRHYGVLLTRAEEMGLIGAIHAAKNRTIPSDARIISIETSRELPSAPVGAGPIIRTGDRATVFDRDLTNRISQAASASGLKHQRKLMDGGGCEATAFGAYGYPSSGLCVALRNWHNRGNLDAVEAGKGKAVAMMEEISLEDFHGLIDLILIAASAADDPDTLTGRLDRLYVSGSRVLQDHPDR
jgi:endoglucanase